MISFHRVVQRVRRRSERIMQTRLYTLGYEGLSLDIFLARLKAAGIETVIDVRANPLSRKRGFSKRSFASALESAGVDYKHIPALGCPKHVRDQYKRDMDWAAYTKGFLIYLRAQSTALAELVDIANASSCCLVCFEADFNRCHRKFVSEAAAQMAPFDIKHFTIQTAIPEEVARSAA
jgi:uncharacterized protein (DUF488 family)